MTRHIYSVGQQVSFGERVVTYLKRTGVFTITKLLMDRPAQAGAAARRHRRGACSFLSPVTRERAPQRGTLARTIRSVKDCGLPLKTRAMLPHLEPTI
jgi:hypothetical protein